MEFSVYIFPSNGISEQASLVNGLRLVNGKLQYKGKDVEALSLEKAIHEFHEFLCSLKSSCILTAHNCKFDYPELVRAVTLVTMKEHFKNIIAGFGDTLPIIKKVRNAKGKGQNKLETLAEVYKVNSSDAHNALRDDQILHEVLNKMEIPDLDIINSSINWNDIDQNKVPKNLAKKSVSSKEKKKAMQDLEVLADCVSKGMRIKMVSAKITYSMII